MMKSAELFVVDETTSSVWNYHIRKNEKAPEGGYRSLCGKQLLGKALPIETHWGLKSDHIPESYCDECKKIYDSIIRAKHGVV